MLFDVVRKLLPFAGLAVVVLAMACGSDDDEGAAPVAPAGAAPQAQQVQPAICEEGQVKGMTRKSYSAPPPMRIDPNQSYTATICLEKGGAMTVELYPQEAPNTVNNFVFLSREAFYDGIKFHRVIADFMAQTGDPQGTGTGGPGYKFASELSPNRRHDGPGVLSMANSGGLNTNGSQFFIAFASGQYSDMSYLDGYDSNGNLKDCATRGVSCHTVFGKVIEGLDVLTGIKQGDVISTIIIKESG